jgi:hypothetical protein
MTIGINNLGFSESILGGHAARSMMLLEMRALIRSLPIAVSKAEFIEAVVEENLLQKPTLSSRKKSLHHLVELYGMDVSKPLFRVLWKLGHDDLESLPQLCVVCTYARDAQLRHSFGLVRTLRAGEPLSRTAMEGHLETGFPARFSPAMKKSMAQNVNTTWTFSGHLTGKMKKFRQMPEPTPTSAAYSMLAGYLSGLRGERLLESAFGALVASNRVQLEAALSFASAKGLLSFKRAAGIVEFEFSNLLNAMEMKALQ